MPLLGETQPSGKVYRIGYLGLGCLLALADRDVRTREAERIKTDLNVIFEVLERTRHAREQRISALVR